MHKHRLQDMTFREFAASIPSKPIILLPLGSQEEHGPMAPMGDFMLTEALALRIAERSGAIVAATLPFGYAEYFRPIPGGIQLRAATFCAVLRDFADNFLDHGLDRLVIINGHSGNAPLIDQVARAIRRDTGVVVPSLNLWRLQTAEAWSAAYGVPGNQGFGHGAEPVGSMYAHLFAHLMRPDAAEKPQPNKTFMGFPPAGMAAVKFRGVDVSMPLDVTDLTDNGITGGDPTMLSAEAGARIAEHIVTLASEFITAFRNAPFPEKPI